MTTWVLTGLLLSGCAAGMEGGDSGDDRRPPPPPRVLDVGDAGPGSTADAGAYARDTGRAADAAPGTATETCELGATRACDPGLDACALGTQACMPSGEFTSWGPCEDITRPTEVCENGLDDDCDGMVDEGCACLDGGDGTAPWQMWMDREVHCFGADLDRSPDEFRFASIPGARDARWSDRAAVAIDFRDPSSIPDDFCDGSHTGGVFTYFQTFIEIPDPTGITLTLRTAGVDDATRATIFNARFPAGHTASGWYAFDAGMSVDFSRHLAPGQNRIVLTHLDDNPSERELTGVTLTLGGTRLGACR